jgi:carbamoylphosphate synthase large subunit
MNLSYEVTNPSLYILRIKKDNPGVGQRLGRAFGADQLVCGLKPQRKIPDGAFVINYGRSEMPVWASQNVRIFNFPEAVAKCVDKRITLNLLAQAGVPCLNSTTSKEQATSWLKEGKPVVVRATATGKKGIGVSLVKPGEDLPDAPLYTEFYDKTHEFRVHVFRGKEGELRVIDLVQKKKMGKAKLAKIGIETVNDLVRNHKRGWVFAHNDLALKDSDFGMALLKSISINAAATLGMDFCAVDILAKIENGKVDIKVCEVNSAPGMSAPATFDAYVKAFTELVAAPKEA